MKLCLSISQHHKEHWGPHWSIRTALIALRSFLPTPGEGAIGSLDYSADQRRALAARSLQYSCGVCGMSGAAWAEEHPAGEEEEQSEEPPKLFVHKKSGDEAGGGAGDGAGDTEEEQGGTSGQDRDEGGSEAPPAPKMQGNKAPYISRCVRWLMRSLPPRSSHSFSSQALNTRLVACYPPQVPPARSRPSAGVS